MKKLSHKLNSDIKFPKVRLIGGDIVKVISIGEALDMAESSGLDLILINENSDIPIVKIEDYNKFIYNIEKKKKDLQKPKSNLKEIKLSTNIADNDLMVKVKSSEKFLKNGDKVKVVIAIKGRENPKSAELTILRFLTLLENFGIPETMPKFESRKWIVFIKPKSK
jgi:translation initiation factor IF-3